MRLRPLLRKTPVFDVVPMDGFAVDTLGDTYYFSGAGW